MSLSSRAVGVWDPVGSRLPAPFTLTAPARATVRTEVQAVDRPPGVADRLGLGARQSRAGQDVLRDAARSGAPPP